jgi:type IV pilus assembly protein PilV
MITIQPNTRQRGTGMVEVMVAAIIIGIGLLGIAALQASSMQASSGAAIRAKAADFAISIADRVRANLTADNCYCTPIACVENGQPLSSCSDNASSRTMAANDIATILAAVAIELPQGGMTISCNDKDATSAVPDNDPCTKGSTMLVTISWSTQRDVGGFGTTDNIVTPFIPGAPTAGPP